MIWHKAACAGSLFVCCSFCWCLPAPGVAASTLTITAPQANVRAGPGLTYQVLMAAPQGAIFPLLASQSGWHQIRLEDGREGWVATSAGTPGPGEPSTQHGCAASGGGTSAA